LKWQFRSFGRIITFRTIFFREHARKVFDHDKTHHTKNLLQRGIDMRLRMEGPVGANTVINGRTFDYFSGTGYLGLQNHPEVISAAVDAMQRYGFSTASSRGGFGEHPLYDEFSGEARAFLECEKELFYSSGYMGASILAGGSLRAGDHTFIDASAHYAFWDAARSCGKITTPFRHRDPATLREALRSELLPGERPVVLTDGIFPITGEIAPLPDYLDAVREYGGLVLVDDAHALGVLGDNGRGTAEEFHIQDETCLSCASLAKALGGFGGLIGGKAGWIDSLEQNSGFYLGASPPPLAVTAASGAGLRLARENPQWRENLWKNAAQARRGLSKLGISCEMTRSPILCIPAESGLNLAAISSGLLDRGIAVSLVRGYPGVPTGGAIRIAIFSTHSREQIERLLFEMNRLV
jgi:7-keto-8-aminopelargonate synthetase-like enzyme